MFLIGVGPYLIGNMEWVLFTDMMLKVIETFGNSCCALIRVLTAH